MSRTEALARYEALPLPTKQDEAWRFTDLADFDPAAFASTAQVERFTTESILPEIPVTAWAEVSETGIRIHADELREGVRFELLTEDHERLHSLVGWDEKFAAHNAALWQH